MKLKINYNYIYIFLLISFLFLWDVNFLVLEKLEVDSLFYKFNISLRYLIIFLLLPIFFFIKKNNYFFSIYKIFNNQKHIIIFLLFILFQYFFINILYSQNIQFNEIISLFFFIKSSLTRQKISTIALPTPKILLFIFCFI